MTAEKYVKIRRAKQREKFGKVGLKKDCTNYLKENKKDFCIVCRHDAGRHRLPCELGVCYFYCNKEEE